MASPRVSRRIALGGMIAAGTAAFDALGIEPHWLDVSLHDVPVERLPRLLEGFTIAQVTDAHLDTLGAVEEAIIGAVVEHEVQLVALTGDIVDATSKLRNASELLRGLAGDQRRLVASLGNWEHWGKVPREDLQRTYRDANTELLVNDARVVEGLRVYATDDATAGNAKFHTRHSKRPTLLLTHSPAFLDTYPKDAPPFALSLAGHTHGGQLRLGAGLVPFLPPGSGRFVAGWYETPTGRSYVSRGTGTSVVPARFTCRPELPLFRLRRA